MRFTLTTSRRLILKKRLQSLIPSVTSFDGLDTAGVTVFRRGRLVVETAALPSGALHAVVYTNTDAAAFLCNSDLDPVGTAVEGGV